MTTSVHRTGSGDCERCRPGVISQPVNAASSLGYVVVGAATLRGGTDLGPVEKMIGYSAIIAGFGSVAFHGPGGRISKLIHDGGLIALLGSIGVADLTAHAERDLGWPAAIAILAASFGAANSRRSEPTQLVVGAVAVLGEALRIQEIGGLDESENRMMVLVACAGAAAQLLGRTGGPLCSPDSLVQPHAFWHLATAATIWLRGRSVERRHPMPGT